MKMMRSRKGGKKFMRKQKCTKYTLIWFASVQSKNKRKNRMQQHMQRLDSSNQSSDEKQNSTDAQQHQQHKIETHIFSESDRNLSKRNVLFTLLFAL